MKFAALLCALILSSVAQASEIEVLEVGYGAGYPRVTLSFEANKKLGRAWIAANVDTSQNESDLGDDSYRQKIEGLRYHEASDSIILEKDGQDIECAKFDKGSFFRVPSFKSTGCTLSYRLVKRVVDDGFETYKVDRVLVLLTIKE